MKELVTKVKELQESRIERLIDKRLKQFKSLNRKSNKDWFSELCFCLLTANTSARLGIKIQKELGYKGFTENKNEEELALRLQKDKREWLVEHIKGLGYKEASHFLRNVGLFDYAIIDKHILNVLREADLIKAKTMNKKNYLRAEDILKKIAKELRMSLGELDLYLWYMKTGEVLK
jgi:N-glycosylase/DNA lyase